MNEWIHLLMTDHKTLHRNFSHVPLGIQSYTYRSEDHNYQDSENMFNINGYYKM
jgi:hypothetical protein